MAEFTFEASSKLGPYVARLKARTPQALLAAIGHLAEGMAADVRQRAPHRSGKLAGSITDQAWAEHDRVMGAITASGPYAHVIEAGFHGTEAIRAHYRRIKQVMGRPVSPRQQLVAAYARHLDLAGIPFMGPVLKAWRPRIEAELAATVNEQVRQS